MNSSTVLVFVLLAASSYAAFALAPDSLSSDDATAATITIKDTPTTTEPPTTSSSTTAEPVTSTVTTTALPTTVNVTTSAPSPNTTAAMTTTASSTTAAPSFADYSLKDNGTVCIRIRGAITFQVPYTSNKTKVVATLVLPRGGGVVTGYCFGTNSSAEIRISWDTSNCEFALGFKLNPDGSWKTVSMNYAFNTTNDSFKSPDKIDVISGGLLKSSDADMYHADKKKSYSCEREDTVLLTNDVRVKFSRFQMQPIPFNGADFNKADVCGASGDSMTNSIVPIAVGCALAGLIVIVLVAYLIGRRRANRGYQQV